MKFWIYDFFTCTPLPFLFSFCLQSQAQLSIFFANDKMIVVPRWVDIVLLVVVLFNSENVFLFSYSKVHTNYGNKIVYLLKATNPYDVVSMASENIVKI